MPSILFVCLANQIRSPIAAATFHAAWLAHPGLPPCRVASAGTWTRSGLPLSQPALSLARAVGLDLHRFRTTSIVDVHLPAYDWIVVMEKGQLEALTIEHPHLRPRIHLLTALAGAYPSDIPDPTQVDPGTALSVLLDLQACVRQLAARLAAPHP